MSHKINSENVGNFISGNWRMFLNTIGKGEPHIAEQVAYRKMKCPECFEKGHCLGNCGCSVPGRWFVSSTCNPDKFGDLLSKKDWTTFKQENGITIV